MEELFEQIPEKMRELIKNLSDEDADKIWLYLDSDPNAPLDMIDYLCKTHIDLAKKISNQKE